jgi:hypothetical protein
MLMVAQKLKWHFEKLLNLGGFFIARLFSCVVLVRRPRGISTRCSQSVRNIFQDLDSSSTRLQVDC